MNTIKLSILILLLTAALPQVSTADEPANYTTEKYISDQPNTTVIEVNFGEETINHNKSLSQLKDKNIYHIDLIYSAYKESPSFDQDNLNKRRQTHLERLIPSINNAKVTWRYIKQTDGQSRAVAKGLFHGFVIYHGEDLGYKTLYKYLNSYQSPFEEHKLNAAEDEVVSYKSGSKVHIPQGALVHKDGSPVIGEYSLKYREFRNPTDILFSGIPMTYASEGSQKNFNSVGMYEIRAEQNGEELALQKPVVVDFNCTNQDDGVGFYKLDESTNQWIKKKDVVFNEAAAPAAVAIQQLKAGTSGSVALNMGKDEFSYKYRHVGDEVQFKFKKTCWTVLKNQFQIEKDFDKIILQDDKKREIHVKREDEQEFNQMLNRNYFALLALGELDGKNIGVQGNIEDDDWDDEFDSWEVPKNSGTLLSESTTDATHMYPTMVKGLNSDSFGVYNCDQLFRIKNRTTISPEYVDSKSGRKINNGFVACLIDLNYNGSFSYNPNSITCNSKGRNVIVLFTRDHKTFLLNESDFSSLNLMNNYRPQLSMRDVTNTIVSSKDLK